MSSDDPKVPVRTEIEVLPADEPKDRKLGWVVREYTGCEVKSVPEWMNWETLERGLPKDFEPEVLRGPLRAGQFVQAWGSLWEVEASSDPDIPQLRGRDGSIGTMVFGGDDRECWVCNGVIAAAAIKHFMMESG